MKGLECILNEFVTFEDECIQKGCPYAHFDNCDDLAIRDAIELLREQEAVKPTPTDYVRTLNDRYYSQIWECGICGENLPGARFETKYCPNCGRKVDWVD